MAAGPGVPATRPGRAPPSGRPPAARERRAGLGGGRAGEAGSPRAEDGGGGGRPGEEGEGEGEGGGRRRRRRRAPRPRPPPPPPARPRKVGPARRRGPPRRAGIIPPAPCGPHSGGGGGGCGGGGGGPRPRSPPPAPPPPAPPPPAAPGALRAASGDYIRAERHSAAGPDEAAYRCRRAPCSPWASGGGPAASSAAAAADHPSAAHTLTHIHSAERARAGTGRGDAARARPSDGGGRSGPGGRAAAEPCLGARGPHGGKAPEGENGRASTEPTSAGSMARRAALGALGAGARWGRGEAPCACAFRRSGLAGPPPPTAGLGGAGGPRSPSVTLGRPRPWSEGSGMWTSSVTLGPSGRPGGNGRAAVTPRASGLRGGGVGDRGPPRSWSEGSGLWSPSVTRRPHVWPEGAGMAVCQAEARSWDSRRENRKGGLWTGTGVEKALSRWRRHTRRKKTRVLDVPGAPDVSVSVYVCHLRQGTPGTSSCGVSREGL
uniref:collagen alpha-1(I) chain-like n=1 Tax=Panthera onca TaxID=9690 RepID=UPI002955C789|nr:collagen alpha-1(I) chain-like [Panthera onca]